jgi:hypothetical protein
MKVAMKPFPNPFRPGAGHMPPYLAGRHEEELEFRGLLKQTTILQNLILTGLRGVGKTVLLETFKPIAIEEGWLWVGTDMAESVSVSEENLAIRLLTDLSLLTSSATITEDDTKQAGFTPSRSTKTTLNYETLRGFYDRTPGLASDKLKHVLEYIWQFIPANNKHGLIFAYDESQNLSDMAVNHQYPLSVLLDVFQSLQRKGMCYMLVLTGLPTLFPKLVETRTYSERMFHVIFLNQLDKESSRDAILKPIENTGCPFSLNNDSVNIIVDLSGGYPYFIQFICKEVYDRFIQNIESGEPSSVPVNEIIQKLDADFYAGRWARVTDRQKELLSVIAHLPNLNTEFTVQEIVIASKQFLKKPFGSSHVNQILAALSRSGLVYKNRYGKYSFAVPMLGHFVKRQVSLKPFR